LRPLRGDALRRLPEHSMRRHAPARSNDAFDQVPYIFFTTSIAA
jgi:hypothetical protein